MTNGLVPHIRVEKSTSTQWANLQNGTKDANNNVLCVHIMEDKYM